MDKAKWFPDSTNPLRVESEGTWQHRYIAESYMRYGFAMRYAAHRDVLDAGCGVCYGASLLSVRAKSVTCANIEPEELAVGTEHFRFYCPVRTVQCDFAKGFPEDQFGLITSFEMIEHLASPSFFLNNVKFHLTPEGIFIFSVPKTPAENRYNDKGVRIGHLQNIQTIDDAKSILSFAFKPEEIKWYCHYEDCSIASAEFSKSETSAVGWMGIYTK